MILADTSIWVDHLRMGDHAMADALERGIIAVHPFVIGELACGRLGRRSEILALLHDLPAVPSASHAEALAFIDARGLTGRGVGYIDVHLLAATALASDTKLWTRDRRLRVAAFELDLGVDLTSS